MRYRVHSPLGRPMARFVHAEDAAMYAQAYGEGATVRVNRTVVYTAGEIHAFDDSADKAAAYIHARERALDVARTLRTQARRGPFDATEQAWS